MHRFFSEEASEDLLEHAQPDSSGWIGRDPKLRQRYLRRALGQIPRLLTAMDRNPFRRTYGCMDREYWHYRTAAFPSGMYQEGVLALAMVYKYPLPGNPWYAVERVRELAEAGVRFAARSSHSDGACDDYYPWERALGAAVFSLAACVRTCALLGLDDPEVMEGLRRRGRWIARRGETGRLTNHHALAALGLAHLARLTQQEEFLQAARQKLQTVLAWQHPEGWFDEYGGADPGYQTLTIDCLAKLRRLVEESLSDAWPDWPIQRTQITQALLRAVRFARWFLQPDFSYGGPVGSRGTRLFFPHGMELLAEESAEAADLADGFLQSLGVSEGESEQIGADGYGTGADAEGTCAHLDDDRMVVHWPAQLLDAYRDWSANRAVAPAASDGALDTTGAPKGGPGLAFAAGRALSATHVHTSEDAFWPGAGLLVRRSADSYTAISTARGGVLVHILPRGATVRPKTACAAPSPDQPVSAESRAGTAAGGGPVGGPLWLRIIDAGLVVETADGRLAVSSLHDLQPQKCPSVSMGEDGSVCVLVERDLCWVRWETASALKQALFYLGMWLAGRFWRSGVRRLLQHRLITGRRKAPLRLSRRIELPPWGVSPSQSAFPPREPCSFALGTSGDALAGLSKEENGSWTLRVTDTIQLLTRRTQVRRMAYGPEGDWIYTAVDGAYHPSVLAPWTNLADQIETLNRTGQVVIHRQW